MIKTRPQSFNGERSAPRILDCNREVLIRLGSLTQAPTVEHQLLIGFRFGGSVCGADPPPVVHLGLDPLDQHSLSEGWWYRGNVTYRQIGSALVTECDDYAAIVVEAQDPPGGDLKSLTCAAYGRLLSALIRTGHPQLVRIWNHIRDINQGHLDNERYRLFSAGRAAAFFAHNIRDCETPVGTAIGTAGYNALTLVALASRHPFITVENPRQISAFNYPRQYGPSSPKFSRSGILGPQNRRLLLVSGTASVVGHKSAFPFDTRKQLEETLTNLGALGHTVANLNGMVKSPLLDANAAFRVYLRNSIDFAAVAQVFASRHNSFGPRVAFLRGDICRRELMVEIEAVNVLH